MGKLTAKKLEIEARRLAVGAKELDIREQRLESMSTSIPIKDESMSGPANQEPALHHMHSQLGADQVSSGAPNYGLNKAEEQDEDFLRGIEDELEKNRSSLGCQGTERVADMFLTPETFKNVAKEKGIKRTYFQDRSRRSKAERDHDVANRFLGNAFKLVLPVLFSLCAA